MSGTQRHSGQQGDDRQVTIAPKSGDESRGTQRLLALLGLFGAVTCVLRPVAAEDFWWQLARGRAVCQGAISPSQELLTVSTGREADWLGGVPVYLLSVGVGVSGLMWIKLLLAVTLSLTFAVACRGRLDLLWLGIGWLWLLASRGAWDLTPATLDLLGIVSIAWLTRRWMTQPTRRRAGLLLVTALVWANSGPLCLLAFPTFLLTVLATNRPSGAPPGGWRMAVLGSLILVACCVTPRHVVTLWDSVRLLIPRLAADAAVLQETLWRPTWATRGQAETLAFLGLSVVVLGQLLASGTGVWRITAAVIILFLGWSAATNVAVAACLMLLLLIDLEPAGERRSFRAGAFLRLTSAVVAGGLIGVSLVGPGHGDFGHDDVGLCEATRSGWGIDPRIAADRFEASFPGISAPGAAHCVGMREAGLVAWLRPAGLQPFDAPHRALLEGRLRGHVLLNDDLRHEWRNRHRREDGTWGGWWITLQERQVRAVIVPSEDVALIRALEPTRWKPLAIDACSLAYGFAGDEPFGPQIAATQQLADYVDRGSWTYTPPAAVGGVGHVDLVGWLTGEHDVSIDVRQSRVLAAMGRPVAALRVLSPARQQAFDNIASEFASIQRGLADQEQLRAGSVSSFRESILQQVSPAGAPTELPTIDASAGGLFDAGGVAAYCRGDFATALKSLRSSDAAARYAAACIRLEAGDPATAAMLLKQSIAESPADGVAILSRSLLLSLAEPVD